VEFKLRGLRQNRRGAWGGHGQNREDVSNLSDLDFWQAAGNAGATTGQDQKIPVGGRADLFCATGSTLTVTTRAGNSFSQAFNSGQPVSLDGRVVSTFNAPKSDWVYVIVPRDAEPTFPSIAPGGGGTGNFTVQLGSGQAFIVKDHAGNTIIEATDTNDAFYAEGVTAIGGADFQINASGIPFEVGGISTAGLGLPTIYAATKQKSETGSADANVMTYAPPSTAGQYRLTVTAEVASATSGVISFTLTWQDSQGNLHSNIALLMFQNQVATPATTFTTSAAGYYSIDFTFSIDNSGTSIVLKWVGGGTSAAKVSSALEQLQ
jgi:hypothetical protein